MNQPDKSSDDGAHQQNTGRPSEMTDIANNNGNGTLERRAFLLLLALVSILFLYLMEPFFTAVFWACVLGIVFHPLQQWLVDRWQRPNLATLTTLIICVCVGVIPVLFILASFFQQGVALYDQIQRGVINPGQYIEQIRQSFPVVQQFIDRFNIDLETIKSQLSSGAVAASSMIAQNAVQVGQNTLQFFIMLGLMLYVAFFTLRDGHWLVALLIRALPIGDERERHLFRKFVEVTRATVKGNMVVAVVQGSLGGFIFWLLGIPAPLLWGVVMTVLSLIPMVGAGLIWVPVAIYLAAMGDWIQALILVAYGVCIIGLADNVLRPILVGRDTKLPDYIVLLSTLGGFALFGINGFVIGPLIAALFVAFWQIFMLEFNPSDDETALAEVEEEGDKK